MVPLDSSFLIAVWEGFAPGIHQPGAGMAASAFGNKLTAISFSPAHLRFEPLLAPISQSRSEGCDDLLLQHAGTFCL